MWNGDGNLMHLLLGVRDQFATQAVREIVACIQSYIVGKYLSE